MHPDAADELERAHTRWFVRHGQSFTDAYVPGEGKDYYPRVMVIGEAPGAEEAVRGRPFVGASGKVLRQLMATAGLLAGNRGHVPSNCWLTNVCKFRPPNNRKPTEPEIKQLRPLLRYEWHAIGCPLIIIPVGGTALFAVTGERWSILKTAGRPWHIQSGRSGREFTVWPMIHPSYALRNKEAQPLLERDWKKLADWNSKWT